MLTESVYAERGWYWWGWGERIAAADDPLTAAHKVATLLRPATRP